MQMSLHKLCGLLELGRKKYDSFNVGGSIINGIVLLYSDIGVNLGYIYIF